MNVIYQKTTPFKLPNSKFDDIAKDAIALFTEQTQGHMERWEYSPSMFPHDPAGGSDHWADLVKNPGQYYLTNADTETIQWAVHQDELLKSIPISKLLLSSAPEVMRQFLKKPYLF